MGKRKSKQNRNKKNNSKSKSKNRNVHDEKRLKNTQKRSQKHGSSSFAGKLKNIVGTLIAFLLFAFAASVTIIYFMYLRGMPDIDISKKNDYSMASVIYDMDGNELALFPGTENVDWVEYNEIPDQLRKAFVAIEDKRFFTHPGVDVKRTLSAVIGQLTHTSEHGGSTITQQLIKNTHLTTSRTYKRKAQEIVLALKLETKLSKQKILEWYLNDIFLGENNYGIKNAARDYFDKDLNELTLRECAMLAGLPQSPSIYDPRLNYYSGTPEITDKRTDDVLYTMHECGYITDLEYREALNEVVAIKQYPSRFELYDYPTYVEWTAKDTATFILQSRGIDTTEMTTVELLDEIRNGGYQIYTAFDKDIQDITQQKLHDFWNYPGTKSEKRAESSAVIMDHKTGRVVAMVGGRDESTIADSYNRATDSIQGVGSSMKPLSVYAPAIDLGDYPGTTIGDFQEKIEGYDTEDGYPGGECNHEMITMRRALELSHNIPAVRFILEDVTLQKSHDYLVANGFNESNLTDTPSGMALGSDGVTTLEMTAGYATLANGGTYITPHAFIRVEDRYGNVILDDSSIERHRVFNESTAWLITDMMETNMVNGLGVNAKLDNMHSCGKTGTNEKKVVSFGGYTPYYTSFVRISTDDYADLINASSYTMSSALWKSYMQEIHNGLADKEIQERSASALGIQKYWVCDNSGKLAQSWCNGHWEYAAPENLPRTYCDGHYWGNEDINDGLSDINYDDPEWYNHGWWGEDGVFHPGWWDEHGNFHQE